MAVKAKRQKDDREVGGDVPPVAKIVRAPHDALQTPPVVRARPITDPLTEPQFGPVPTRTVPDDAVERVPPAAAQPEPADYQPGGPEVTGYATNVMFAVSAMRSGAAPGSADKTMPTPGQAMGVHGPGVSSTTFKPTIGSVSDHLRHFFSGLIPLGGLLSRITVLMFVLIGGMVVASVLSDLHTARPQLLARPAAMPRRSTPLRVSLGRSRPLQIPIRLTAQQPDALRVVLSWRPLPYATSYLVQIEHKRYATGLSHLSISGTLQPAKRYSWWVRGMRQNRAGPRSQRAVLLLRPLPAQLWRFAPVRPPADRVLFTLYNPNPVAADGSISVIRHGWNELERVRIPAGGSVDVRLPTVSAMGATKTTTVGASLPILVQRLATKGNTVQSAYGTPIR